MDLERPKEDESLVAQRLAAGNEVSPSDVVSLPPRALIESSESSVQQSSPQQRGMITWISLPPEIQARIFCESARLFYCGLLTCKRLQQCILRHASRLPESTRQLALELFMSVSRSGIFRKLSEMVMCDLLGDDDLMGGEEDVLQAVVAWIKECGEKGCGERLLGEIRYGLLEASRLQEVALRADEMLGGFQGARLRDLANEALVLLNLPPTMLEIQGHGQLGSRAFDPRKGTNIAWGDYAGGRRQHQLVLDNENVWSLGGSGGRVFCGLAEGCVIEWDASNLEERRRLQSETQVGRVFCVEVFGDLLISGNEDACLRVWNMTTGSCDQVLRGHSSAVWCMASSEQYLVSGSWDRTVKVWGIGGAGSWPCLGTITVHTGLVRAVLVWEGKAISGSDDSKIDVSDIVTRQNEKTLDAHTGSVLALAVSGRALLSTGRDGTIGVWALGTWSHLRTVRLSEHLAEAVYSKCLAVSGSMLLCGGVRKGGRYGFMVVLDAATLSFQHTLQLEHDVRSLLSVRGQVWAKLGSMDVVMWGKGERWSFESTCSRFSSVHRALAVRGVITRSCRARASQSQESLQGLSCAALMPKISITREQLCPLMSHIAVFHAVQG